MEGLNTSRIWNHQSPPPSMFWSKRRQWAFPSISGSCISENCPIQSPVYEVVKDLSLCTCGLALGSLSKPSKQQGRSKSVPIASFLNEPQTVLYESDTRAWKKNFMNMFQLPTSWPSVWLLWSEPQRSILFPWQFPVSIANWNSFNPQVLKRRCKYVSTRIQRNQFVPSVRRHNPPGSK